MESKIVEIKKQLTYASNEAKKVKEKFPNNKEAYNHWIGMVEAYNISLQILEGK